MRYPLFAPSITRLSGRPRPEIAPGVPRPQGKTGRPHHHGTFNEVRGLIEHTTLTYEQIRARTGVSPASISRWMQDGEWKRPLFAPVSHNTRTPRASAYLKRRMLARRLLALAERYVRELEEAKEVDLEKLAQALDVWRMARLGAMRRTPRRREAAMWGESMRPVIELCTEGVNLRAAPREAVDDFLKHRAKPREEDKPPKSRGRSRLLPRAWQHKRMLERG